MSTQALSNRSLVWAVASVAQGKQGLLAIDPRDAFRRDLVRPVGACSPCTWTSRRDPRCGFRGGLWAKYGSNC